MTTRVSVHKEYLHNLGNFTNLKVIYGLEREVEDSEVEATQADFDERIDNKIVAAIEEAENDAK